MVMVLVGGPDLGDLGRRFVYSRRRHSRFDCDWSSDVCSSDLAQIAKTGLFPSQVEALGAIGIGIGSDQYWGPTWPYTSSLTTITAQQLADGYQTSAGKQWNRSEERRVGQEGRSRWAPYQ